MKPAVRIPKEERPQALEAIIERYSRGEEISTIAKEYDMADVSIYRYLLADKPDEFRQAQVARAMLQFERAAADRDRCAEALKTAPDQLELNRQTALMKNAESVEKRAQWLMERILTKIYGQDKDTRPPVAIQINLTRDN